MVFALCCPFLLDSSPSGFPSGPGIFTEPRPPQYFHRDFHPDRELCSAFVKCDRTFGNCLSSKAGAVEEEAESILRLRPRHQHNGHAVSLADHCKYLAILRLKCFIWNQWLVAHIVVKANIQYIAVNKKQKPCWPFWLQARPTDLSFMVPPPAKNWEPELKMSERFLLRFYFVCSLFVWELLSPRWTATRSTFRLTMGSTATQSTGGKKNNLKYFSGHMALVPGELDRSDLETRWWYQTDQTPSMADTLNINSYESHFTKYMF